MLASVGGRAGRVFPGESGGERPGTAKLNRAALVRTDLR